MATINIRVEGPRGCGHRKPGGFYLVADGKGRSCECLPMPVPSTINTSRGPQWRTLGEFTGTGLSRKSCQGAKPCWLRKTPTPTEVMLNFVGMGYYRRTEQFMREAERMGISRRIPGNMIWRVEVGKTIILLAHREASNVIGPDGPEAVRQVFAAFIPQRVEYIVTGQEDEAYLDLLEQRGVTLIKLQAAGKVLDLGFGAN